MSSAPDDGQYSRACLMPTLDAGPGGLSPAPDPARGPDGKESTVTQVSESATVDFPEISDAYRRELTAHCYRMTGSIHDAEDLVQETYLRAWRAYAAFEGRSSVRTWLYRIATNVCLTALEGKDRRPLPAGLGTPSSDAADRLVESAEVSWLEPAPDPMVAGESSDPASIVGQRESIRLAFI